MKQTLKRTLALVLAFVMCVLMLPDERINASATGKSKNFYARVNGTYMTSEGDLEDELSQYLSVSIKLYDNWIMKSRLNIPKNRSVTLDLNGYVMTRDLTEDNEDQSKVNGEVICLQDNARLTIIDSNPNKVNGGYVNNDIWQWNSSSHSYQISGGVITGGAGWDGAGGIHAKSGSTVIMKAGTLAGNYSDDGGGGIYMTGSSSRLELRGGAIMYNKSNDHGGGVYLDGGRMEITNTLIEGNSVKGSFYGGGIYVNSGESRAVNIHGTDKNGVNSVQFRDNKAQYGGAIYLAGGDAPLIQNAEFYSNTSTADGAAVYVNVEKAIVAGSEFSYNEALGSGGAIYANQETISVANCALSNNRAKKYGGAIYFNDDNPALSDCTIEGNRCGERDNYRSGGGVYCDSDVDLQPLSISGKMIIRNNFNYARSDNLYIAGDDDLTVGTLDRESVIYISVGSGSSYTGISKPFTHKPTNVKEDYFFSDYDGTYVARQEDPNSSNYRHLYIANGSRSKAQPTKITSTEPSEVSIYKGSKLLRGYFRYPSVTSDVDYTSVYYYSDGFFFSSPVDYDPCLATMSLNLAMSAFGANAGGSEDYTNKFSHVTQLMADIGCTDIYVNDFFTEKPGVDSIGVAISQKSINVDNNRYTLIPIAIRGAGYESEWASNVTIGSNGEAQGFASAADQVTAEVKKYLNEHNLNSQANFGKVKFWVVGYSRAGATANLTGKRLTDEFGAQSVYGYSFEPPRGAQETGDYSNLFCLLNPSDIVPLVAPALMGFTHYGREIKMYDKVDYSDSKYMTLRAKALQQLGAINPEIQFEDYFHPATINYLASGLQDKLGIGSDMITEKTWKGYETAEKWLPKFMSDLQEWSLNTGSSKKNGSSGNTNYREFYSSQSTGILRDNSTKTTGMTFQQAIAVLVPIVFGASAETKAEIMDSMNGLTNRIDTTKVWDDIIGDLYSISISKYDAWIDSFYNILFGPPTEDDLAKGYSTLYDKLTPTQRDAIRNAWPTLAAVLFDFVNDDYNGNISRESMHLGTMAYNIDVIAQAHYPEVNLAWMRAKDPLYSSEITRYELVNTAAPSAPTAEINDAALSTSPYLGDQTLKLSSASGAAIYYTITTQVGSGSAVTSGKQLYKNGIPLTVKGEKGVETRYTVTAYARQYDKNSASAVFEVTINNPAQILTVVTDSGTELFTYNSGQTVTIDAKTPGSKVFDAWAVSGIEPAGWASIKSKEVASFTMPAADITVTANYTNKVGTIGLYDLEEPRAGMTLASEASVKFDGAIPDSPVTASVMWTVGDTPVSGQKAEYNTSYTANVTLTPGAKRQFADDVNATVYHSTGDRPATIYRNKADGSVVIRYTFPATQKASLRGVTQPAAVSVPHGTSASEMVSSYLPKKTEILTLAGTQYADIVWNVPVFTPKADNTAQDVTATGKVTLPSDIVQPSAEISLGVQTTVHIAAGDQWAAPTALLVQGAYDTAKKLYFTPDQDSSKNKAPIRYKITDDGTEPSDPTTNGTLYDGDTGISLPGGEPGQTVTYKIKAYSPAASDRTVSEVMSYTYSVRLPGIYKVTVKCSDSQGYTETKEYRFEEGSSVVLIPSVIADEKFHAWGTSSVEGTVTEEKSYTFTMPRGDVTINAEYVPVVSKVAMTIGAPTAGQTMPTLEDCTIKITNEYHISTDSFDVTWTPAPVDGKAAYNTTYTAKMKLKDVIKVVDGNGDLLYTASASNFVFADTVTTTVGGATATLDKEEKAVYFTFSKTDAAKLLSIATPEMLSFDNGVSANEIIQKLNSISSVGIDVMDKSVNSAPVRWDTGSISTQYNASTLKEQKFTVTGMLTVPDFINTDGRLPFAYQTVYIASAPLAPVPTATLRSGTYVGTQTIALNSEVENAVIYYTTDGSTPTTSSAKYTDPITVSSDMTIRAFVAPPTSARLQNSSTATFEYKITSPSFQLTLYTTDSETPSVTTYDLNSIVTINANVPFGKVFAGWKAVKTDDPETDVTKSLGLNSNSAVASFTMPGYDVTITATYQNKIKKIELSGIAAPIAGLGFGNTAAAMLKWGDSETESLRQSAPIVWTEVNGTNEAVVSSSTAGYNKSYIANITLKAVPSSQIEFLPTISANDVNVNAGTIDSVTYSEATGNIAVRVKYTTALAKINRIISPAASTMSHTTSADDIKTYLDNTVKVVEVETESGEIYLPVTWNTPTDYTAIAGQDVPVTVTGFVRPDADTQAEGFPAEYDANGVSTDVQASVTVLEGAAKAAPTADLVQQTYTEEKMLKLTAQTDDVIYYTTDGSDPTAGSSNFTTSGTITLDGNSDRTAKTHIIKAYVAGDGAETTDSSVVTFVYTIDLPDFEVNITSKDTGLGNWSVTSTKTIVGGQAAIAAPNHDAEIFDHWENGADTNVVTSTNRNDRILVIDNLTSDMDLIAVYKPVVSHIAVEMDAPVAGSQLPQAVTSCTVTIRASHNVTSFMNVSWTPEESSGKAGYNRSYTAVVSINKSLMPSSVAFVYADNAAATVNGNSATLNKTDSKIYYTFPATGKVAYSSVTAPQTISVSNGTSKDAIKSALPSTVEIKDVNGTAYTTPVTWLDFSYDSTKNEAQTLIITGSITLPDFMQNGSAGAPTVTQTVHVAAATVYSGLAQQLGAIVIDHGTAAQDILARLPSTVKIDVTVPASNPSGQSTKETRTASVVWPNSVEGYDPNSADMCTLAITGTIQLPSGVKTETEEQSLAITQTVKVESKPVYTGVIKPVKISVANGTDKQAIEALLPQTVRIQTRSTIPGESESTPIIRNYSADAAVVWGSMSYNPSSKDAQEFTIVGTITIPDTVVIPNDVTTPVTVEQIVSVAAAPVEPVTPPSGGSGGGSSSNTTTQKNPDGSTTTTVTKPDGSKTETTKKTDGSTTIVETKKDGTVIETNKTASGVTATTVTDKTGTVTEVKTEIPASAVTKNETVTLPVKVPASAPADDALTVKISVLSGVGGVKVEIPVANVTPGTVAVIVKADGTEEVDKTSVPTENGVAIKVEGETTVKLVDRSREFADVHKTNHWSKNAVDFVVARDLFSGTSTTTFSPDQSTTRGMLTRVLYNLANNPKVDVTKGFSDVDNGAYYADAVKWASDDGLVSGYGNGRFGPEDVITREQLAAILYRYAGSPVVDGRITGFTDADKASKYANTALVWAIQNGIMSGKGQSILDPRGKATRGEVAQMMWMYVSLGK